MKACCADLYASDAVRWLLGDELHPGGDRTTLRLAELAGLEPGERVVDIAAGPGASARLLARTFGDYIAKQVGQAVVVENKAGATGSIGAAEVARAAPDGHTILCSIATTYVLNRVMLKNPGYDMDRT